MQIYIKENPATKSPAAEIVTWKNLVGKEKNMQTRTIGKNVMFISAVIIYSKIKTKNSKNSDVEKLVARKPGIKIFLVKSVSGKCDGKIKIKKTYGKKSLSEKFDLY